MRFAVALAMVLGAALTASADDCALPGTNRGILPAAGDVYLVIDPCQATSCTLSVWLYEESNGLADLQRGDEFWDETCTGTPADTLHAGFFEPWSSPTA